jgi:O-methyltransferase
MDWTFAPGWTTGKACAILLADADGTTPDESTVLGDVAQDRALATSGKLADRPERRESESRRAKEDGAVTNRPAFFRKSANAGFFGSNVFWLAICLRSDKIPQLQCQKRRFLFMRLVRHLFYELTYRFPSQLNRAWMAHYSYQFTPAQLCFLCSCIEQTRSLPGPIIEAGVSRGFTTIFLNKHLDTLGIERSYLALDTFAGFLQTDVDYEVRKRGKPASFTWKGFNNNRREWFDRSMRLSGVNRVRSIECDVATAQYPDEISFCLLDVDLYLPTKAALARIYPKMAKGGILVVDDCANDGGVFDGAGLAQREFCQENGLTPVVVNGKLGVFYV